MCPAVDDRDRRAALAGGARQPVITGIAIQLQDAIEALQNQLGMGASTDWTIGEDHVGRVIAAPSTIIPGKRPVPYDPVLRCRTAHGRLFWARSVAVAVRDACEAIVALEGAFQDITVEQNAKFAQRDAESDLTSVLDTMPSGFFVLDEDWRFAFLNPASEVMLRRRPDSLVGKNVWEAFPEAIGSEFENVYRRVMDCGDSETFVAHFAPLETTFRVSAHRTQRGIAVHFQDVTLQEETKRRAEKSAAELQKTLDRLSSVANVAPVLQGFFFAPALYEEDLFSFVSSDMSVCA